MGLSDQSGFVKPACVALPPRRKRTVSGLLVLALLVPPLAVYLDGGSNMAVLINFLLWIFVLGFGHIHAICYLLRSKKSRSMSRPMRYRLWVESAEGKRPQEDAPRSLQSAPEGNKSQAPTTATASAPKARPEDNPFRDTSTTK